MDRQRYKNTRTTTNGSELPRAVPVQCRHVNMQINAQKALGKRKVKQSKGGRGSGDATRRCASLLGPSAQSATADTIIGYVYDQLGLLHQLTARVQEPRNSRLQLGKIDKPPCAINERLRVKPSRST